MNWLVQLTACHDGSMPDDKYTQGVVASATSLPPARLRYRGHGYALDPDKRHAWRGVEVVKAAELEFWQRSAAHWRELAERYVPGDEELPEPPK